MTIAGKKVCEIGTVSHTGKMNDSYLAAFPSVTSEKPIGSRLQRLQDTFYL